LKEIAKGFASFFSVGEFFLEQEEKEIVKLVYKFSTIFTLFIAPFVLFIFVYQILCEKENLSTYEINITENGKCLE